MRGTRTLIVPLIVILVFQLTAAAIAAPARPAPIPAAVQLTPIPIDDPELVNPARGFYKWRGEETVPVPEPAHDEYERYFWYDPDHPEESIETAPGVYNFAMIDRAISAAGSRGNKFAFRIRSMANKRSGKRHVPDYLAECGWEYRGTFIPDWNAACYLDNAEKLMDALGARYNADPRIAWMDIGLFGEWGEWAMSEDIYNSAPDGFSIPTEKSMARIIDIQVDAFPDVRKVMFAKTDAHAVIHALGRSDQIGWRVDCFGRDGYFDFPSHPEYLPAWEHMQDRWKTAPVIVEFCAGNLSLSSSVPLKQVQEFHIALIGNGNIGSWDRLDKKKQTNLIALGKAAGYRFQIRHVAVPSVLAPGSSFRVTTDWENVGVAPHYERTAVLFRLYDRQRSEPVWEAESSVDLQALLPTGDRPFSVQDKLTLPANIDPGIYQLGIIVTDPTNYRQPLKLAIAGRQEDGSYLLGDVIVRAPARRR